MLPVNKTCSILKEPNSSILLNIRNSVLRLLFDYAICIKD
jgi:hypothetical protein